MNVVAIVPAKDRADTVGATVAALRGIRDVGRVVVVDDGSADDTTEAARRAGAEVLRLPTNRGKGGAVAAALAAAPDADAYLLVDADTGPTAAAAAALLDALAGGADMAVGVLPPAGRRGGLGWVRRIAAAGIRRAVGWEPAAPLSGQRAVRGSLMRRLQPAERFGLEVGLTIDALRAGARVVEVPVAMEHRHTGRRLAGFRHRAGQGLDVLRALWPRLTTPAQRAVAIVAAFAVLTGGALASGGRWVPAAAPAGERPGKVVLFGMPHLGFDDLGRGRTPNLDRLVAEGAVAAMSVRTLSGRPSTVEGYASLNAGTRVRAPLTSAEAYPADAPVENGTAAEVSARRVGRPPRGDVVVAGYPQAVLALRGARASSEPGALGDALRAAGRRTAVVGNADAPGVAALPGLEVNRPVAMALADRRASVGSGVVDRSLLVADPTAPFGVRADAGAVVAAVRRALADADVVAVDPGDLDRADLYRRVVLDRAAEAARERALERTDAILGAVRRILPRDALLVVVSVSPPSRAWHLTPVVVAGPGIPHGYVQSPGVRRLGVVTVTDVAPTVLEALGARVPDGMIGSAFRYRPDTPDFGYLRRLDRDANFREGIYFPIALTYIVVQGAVYVVAMLALGRGYARTGVESLLRWAVTAIAAFPLATFLFRAVPEVARLGAWGVAVLVALDLAVAAVAVRARRHPLSPLTWVAWATVGLIVVDLALGARLQYSSLLGYSLHTAARFYGLGNTAFAVLAASALVAACAHVEYAPRRRDALLTAAGLLVLVAVADGAPALGNDVGGILTLVPVFGVTLWALWGRRVSWRALAGAVAVLAVVLGAAAAVELARPPAERSHLGRFLTDLASGNGEAATTVARKAATNARVLGASIWTWMVPIAAVFALFVLVFMGRGGELLPRGSARRIGVVAVIAAGLIGFAVNDSGVVVTALVAVYLGPYITLLALDADRGGPVVFPPLPAGTPAAGDAAPLPVR
jgi:hypothetical protein